MFILSTVRAPPHGDHDHRGRRSCAWPSTCTSASLYRAAKAFFFALHSTRAKKTRGALYFPFAHVPASPPTDADPSLSSWCSLEGSGNCCHLSVHPLQGTLIQVQPARKCFPAGRTDLYLWLAALVDTHVSVWDKRTWLYGHLLRGFSGSLACDALHAPSQRREKPRALGRQWHTSRRLQVRKRWAARQPTTSERGS